MTTTMPSRSAIERAEPLEFTPRQRQSEPLTVTIHATIGGYAMELCTTATVDQLPALAARLNALGAAPVQPTPVAQQSPATPVQRAQNGAQRVTPIYDDSGEACCPVHKKPLVEGSYGLYCKSKAQPGDKQNDKGYCSLKFE